MGERREYARGGIVKHPRTLLEGETGCVGPPEQLVVRKLPILEPALRQLLAEHRYESKTGLGERGLMDHHIEALLRDLVPFIMEREETLVGEAQECETCGEPVQAFVPAADLDKATDALRQMAGWTPVRGDFKSSRDMARATLKELDP